MRVLVEGAPTDHFSRGRLQLLIRFVMLAVLIFLFCLSMASFILACDGEERVAQMLLSNPGFFDKLTKFFVLSFFACWVSSLWMWILDLNHENRELKDKLRVGQRRKSM